MQTLPSVLQDFIDNSKRILEPWIQYLSQFTIAPPAFMDLFVGTSPYEYQTQEPGNIYISGGTISGITLTRGSDTLTIPPTASFVPVAVDDIVEVTYSVLPTMKFIPSYGVNTNG